DWIEKNPVYFGPNWINTMEVAIRACNWIFSWEVIVAKCKLNTGNKLDKEFLEKFLGSLVEHGRFIYRNLEYTQIRSNHYLSNIIGLVYVGIMFPEFKESKKWLKKGLKALEEEMKFQVYDDGVDYELSIAYHRYATELFLWAGRLCKENHINLSLEFLKKLEKMVEFSDYYTKPNNLAPQIGDADDRRLHIVWEDFYNWEKRNHFALFKLYNHVFGKTLENTEKSSKSFSKSGFYIIRDKDFYLITGRNKCCHGKGGSHVHNDILSFELSMIGNDFIVDPGTYVYTPDFKARNRFRSTRAHNTVMIDNQEQNPISKDPFYIEQTGELTVNQWETKGEEIILEAEHDCYERLRCSVVHNRTFSFNKKERVLHIKDKFKGRGDHELEWNFHLSSEIKIWVKEDRAEQKEVILIGNNGSLIFSVPKVLNCVIIEDKVSLSYGNKIPAKTIRLTGFLKQGFPREYTFTFHPLKQ
ncbi:MAG TPA: alginate lyase family protein, partial [Candidatus Paceibacterota bacterium]|nr:alginate lyase family protein [Candidatus Paceibacterota bacterium]